MSFVMDSTGFHVLDAAQAAGAGLSFLTGTVTASLAEFGLETWPNSSDSSVEDFCGLRRRYLVGGRE